MTTQSDLLDTARAVQLGNYRPSPIVLARGEGRRVWDADGRAYLDLAGGIAVTSVGHAHPRLAEAISRQAHTLMHVSNLFYNDKGIELAKAITARSGYDRVFFCNSGAEANEAMLKLARRHAFARGDVGRTEIVATWNSFHGRTMGALTMTGQPKYHEGVGPMLPGVSCVAYGDLVALKAAVGKNTAAFILEPIQAEGGVIVASDEYLLGARAICDEAGALLLFDEVQTGYGRTGKFLAREHTGVWPDACSLAKGIAGGFPLGAMLVRANVADALVPGTHGTTFGGNPLACAAALEVLRIFDDEGIIENAEKQGVYAREKLGAMQSRCPAIAAVRGLGLLIGIALADGVDGAGVLAAIHARGVLATLASPTVIRLVPALNITEAELDEGLAVIEAVLKDPPRKSS
jgi:acetylornithine/N-succinyldiaminopimelate aminotransferase